MLDNRNGKLRPFDCQLNSATCREEAECCPPRRSHSVPPVTLTKTGYKNLIDQVMVEL